ncbi:hypothetical protein [Dyella sp. 2RAB6]|uniref:hypothetical protein n=1 Tax=Dyella sp. 2RAB6 TaxID=3232992 RepID=UPI003F8E0BEA
MNSYGEPWITRHANYFSDPDASPDALLNIDIGARCAAQAHGRMHWLQVQHKTAQPSA